MAAKWYVIKLFIETSACYKDHCRTVLPNKYNITYFEIEFYLNSANCKAFVLNCNSEHLFLGCAQTFLKLLAKDANFF